MSVSLSTHVLDTERGEPAAGVTVELYRGQELVSAQETDGDGRIANLVGAGGALGSYGLVFHPPSPFFRRVELELELDDTRHYHVPLLVSSYQCTTYRGS